MRAILGTLVALLLVGCGADMNRFFVDYTDWGPPSLPADPVGSVYNVIGAQAGPPATDSTITVPAGMKGLIFAFTPYLMRSDGSIYDRARFDPTLGVPETWSLRWTVMVNNQPTNLQRLNPRPWTEELQPVSMGEFPAGSVLTVRVEKLTAFATPANWWTAGARLAVAMEPL